MLNCDSIHTSASSKSSVLIIVDCVAGVLAVLILIVILVLIKKVSNILSCSLIPKWFYGIIISYISSLTTFQFVSSSHLSA